MSGITPVPNASYLVKRTPFKGSETPTVLLSDKPLLGELDEAGSATIDLAESSSGSRYVLTVREHGSWEFEVGNVDGPLVPIRKLQSSG